MSRTNQNTRSVDNLEVKKALGKESLVKIEGIDEEPLDFMSKNRKASNLSKIESRNSIHYKNKTGTYQ